MEHWLTGPCKWEFKNLRMQQELNSRRMRKPQTPFVTQLHHRRRIGKELNRQQIWLHRLADQFQIYQYCRILPQSIACALKTCHFGSVQGRTKQQGLLVETFAANYLKPSKSARMNGQQRAKSYFALSYHFSFLSYTLSSWSLLPALHT